MKYILTFLFIIIMFLYASCDRHENSASPPAHIPNTFILEEPQISPTALPTAIQTAAPKVASGEATKSIIPLDDERIANIKRMLDRELPYMKLFLSVYQFLNYYEKQDITVEYYYLINADDYALAFQINDDSYHIHLREFSYNGPQIESFYKSNVEKERIYLGSFEYEFDPDKEYVPVNQFDLWSECKSEIVRYYQDYARFSFKEMRGRFVSDNDITISFYWYNEDSAISINDGYLCCTLKQDNCIIHKSEIVIFEGAGTSIPFEDNYAGFDCDNFMQWDDTFQKALELFLLEEIVVSMDSVGNEGLD